MFRSISSRLKENSVLEAEGKLTSIFESATDERLEEFQLLGDVHGARRGLIRPAGPRAAPLGSVGEPRLGQVRSGRTTGGNGPVFFGWFLQHVQFSQGFEAAPGRHPGRIKIKTPPPGCGDGESDATPSSPDPDPRASQ